MAYTAEQLLEISTFVNYIVALTHQLTEEAKVPLADRLITPANITNINENIADFSDYIDTLVPPT